MTMMTVAVLCMLAAPLLAGASECPDSDVEIAAGCDPLSTTDANLEKCLPKKQMIFGVQLRGAADVPDWAFTYGANVLSQLLDSDMDGVADDAALISALKNTNHGKLGFLLLKCRGTIGGDTLKNAWYGIARTHGQKSLDGDTRFQGLVLEEFHHGIYHGLEKAYPSVFSSESSTSELREAVKESFGNCELAAECSTQENCQHYSCTCSNGAGNCDDKGQYECSFVKGSCQGAFHYAVPSCGPGGCLTTEGFWHAWAAANGYECRDGLTSSDEWELCSQAKFAADKSVEKLFKLVTGKAASQKELGYVLPKGIPDGKYAVTPGPTQGPNPGSTPKPTPGEVSSSGRLQGITVGMTSAGLIVLGIALAPTFSL